MANQDFLKLPVAGLSMVGSFYAARLSKLKIETIGDLLHHYPFRYDDLSLVEAASKLEPGQTVTLQGSILDINSTYTRSGKTIQRASFSDGSITLDVTWFNQPYLVTTLRNRNLVALSGKVKEYRGKLSLQSPQYEILNPAVGKTTIHTGRLVPVYHETAGVSSRWLRSRIAPLLKSLKDLEDWLPQGVIKREGLLPLKEALKKIHFPESTEDIKAAKERLGFDELLLLQLKALTGKKAWQDKKAKALKAKRAEMAKLFKSLPFELTGAQKRVWQEISADLESLTPMNRLLQGDVGAGKTVVATAALYQAYTNGSKGVLMAPTEVLALQHAKSLNSLLEPLGVRLSIQTGSMKDKFEAADVYIGTHALLYRELPANLGVVVIDEQHRFGVEQRGKLLKQDTMPHLISMTATPIPRTIALTLYSDLNLSVIDELPPGRKPIKTWVVPHRKRVRAYDWIKKQIKETGAQVFVVCPLIEDSETPMLDQVKAVSSEYERLKQIFGEYNLGLLHGRMKSKEKAAAIQDFRQGKTELMVATPVIEVGVDIPNAAIIVIEGAERFGLASLHQLRGRVGRSDQESYCLLFTSPGVKTTRRLKEMERTHSGIELAEIDLKLRGPGDLYGTEQSGFIDLKIASLHDAVLIARTHRVAEQLLKDPAELDRAPLLKAKIEALLEKAPGAN